jgi:hypothetical protein
VETKGRMLQMISETWSRGPSLIPSLTNRGCPHFRGSEPCHVVQYISLRWLTNRGSSDHCHSKKDPISLCKSDGMRHYLCTRPSSPVSYSFHYTGAAFGSSVITCPMDRASAQDLYRQSLSI